MPTAPGLPPRPTASSHNAPPRLTTTQRGYGQEHRRTRARLLALHPLCQWCAERWSHHLHHVDRNTHNRAPGNLVMLCVECHEREHGRG
jgi:5-methylcytosine-specific restriction endonuclease McrA